MWASKVCTASKECSPRPWTLLAFGLLALGLACGRSPATAVPSSRAPAAGYEFFVAPASDPAAKETACAWYGDARDGILYFGESAFWSGLRETGSPLADLDHSGPQRIGRFDLETRAMRSPLVLARQRPGGTWDVLAHPNGRVYFTTLFEDAGWVDPESGEVERFSHLGAGLNEWALGPDETLLASRYGGDGASGNSKNSILWLDTSGRKLAELPVGTKEGDTLAPKTVAWDRARDSIWVTTDRLPERAGPGAHPTVVLDFEGRRRAVIDDVEIQYVRFAADATGYFAVVSGRSLELAILPPEARGPGLEGARRIPLDANFNPELDFAQDLNLTSRGHALVTTWGGRIFAIDPADPGNVRTLDFPRPRGEGLYYTAVGEGEHLCATYCAGLTVVCTRSD